MIVEELNKDDYHFIEIEKVIDLIKNQLDAVMSLDAEYYSQFKFEISNEQFYVPDEDREPGKIYIIVKFLPADIDFGQDVLPITIQAISEYNGLEAVQKLLLEYAQIFNLKVRRDEDNELIYQTYTTPSVISNFEAIYEGFRSVLVMSGSFLLSKNINRVNVVYFDGDSFSIVNAVPDAYATDLIECDGSVYKWNGTGYEEYNGEQIDLLNYSDTADITPDTQPYFENKNFTESIAKFGTFSFNISSFLISSKLINKVLKIRKRMITIDTNFYFKIMFDIEELSMPLLPFKHIHSSINQNKGELPSFVMAFTN